MNTNDLKNEIDEVIKHIIVNNMLLWFINEPSIIDIFKKTFVVDIAGFIKTDGSGKTISLHSAFDFCKSNPQFNLKYLKKVLTIEINWIFENLPYKYQQSYKNAYEGKNKNTKEIFSKEFEFFRHIRNACAHGNIFNLKNKKREFSKLFDKVKNPHYEASWKNFSIDPKLHTSELFFIFLQGGDAIELLEFVRDNI